MQSLCIILFINKYIPIKYEGMIMDMKRRSYTFKYFLIPEFGNLTLIRAMAVIRVFFFRIPLLGMQSEPYSKA